MSRSVDMSPDPTPQRLCASSDLVDGGIGMRFEVASQSRQTGPHQMLSAFAIRHAGEVRAYLNQCAHVPVELDWQPGVFFDDQGEFLVCATHGASYRPADGRCAGGPCRGRGLQPVPCFEADGSVFIAWPLPNSGTSR